MSRAGRRRGAWWLAATAALGLAQLAQAQVVAPCEPPPALAGLSKGPALAANYDRLKAESVALQAAMDAYNGVCDQDLEVGSPEQVDCEARRTALAARYDAYQRARAAYAADVDGAAAASAAEIDAKLKRMRVELEKNGARAQAYQSAIDEWVKLGADSREAARGRALKLGVDLALHSATDTVAEEARFHRDMTAQEAGLMRRDWGAIVDRLSRMPADQKAALLDQLSNLKTLEQAMKFLDHGYEAIDAAYAVGSAGAEDNEETRKEAALETLKLVQSLGFASPMTGLMITDLESANNAVYGWWAALAMRNRLIDFTRLDESLFAAATQEAKQYEALTRLKLNPKVCPEQ